MDNANGGALSRRRFYTTFIGLIGSAITAAVALPAAAYLLFKPRSAQNATLIEIADLADLQTGKPQEIVYFRTRMDGWKRIREKATAWVVKTKEGDAVAFSPQCPHLGCIYHWEGRKDSFVCPCHESSFSADGEVLGGPAPRPLDRYVSKVEGGKLLVGLEVEKS